MDISPKMFQSLNFFPGKLPIAGSSSRLIMNVYSMSIFFVSALSSLNLRLLYELITTLANFYSFKVILNSYFYLIWPSKIDLFWPSPVIGLILSSVWPFLTCFKATVAPFGSLLTIISPRLSISPRVSLWFRSWSIWSRIVLVAELVAKRWNRWQWSNCWNWS